MDRDGNYVIQVEDLVKLYPGVRAVDGISFAIQPGEFFGFLGPNGAGKSTTIKILATLTRKTSGEVTVAGFDPDENPHAVRRAIGFAMQAQVGQSTDLAPPEAAEELGAQGARSLSRETEHAVFPAGRKARQSVVDAISAC